MAGKIDIDWEVELLTFVRESGIAGMIADEIAALIKGADFEKFHELFISKFKTAADLQEYTEFREHSTAALVDKNFKSIEAQRKFVVSIVGAMLMAI